MTEVSGSLQTMGSQRVGHDRTTNTFLRVRPAGTAWMLPGRCWFSSGKALGWDFYLAQCDPP